MGNVELVKVLNSREDLMEEFASLGLLDPFGVGIKRIKAIEYTNL